jgi:hypothetical protein
MIKVMDCYNDLRDTTDEVVKVFELAGMQAHPAMVVGVTNMLYMARLIEKMVNAKLDELNKASLIMEPHQ